MTIITIPKHLAHKDLVLIPRKEYEEMKKAQPPRVFKEVPQTLAQKRDLAVARRDYARGNVVTLDVLKRDMERRSSR